MLPPLLDLTPTESTRQAPTPHLWAAGVGAGAQLHLPAWPPGEEPTPTAAPAHHDLEGPHSSRLHTLDHACALQPPTGKTAPRLVVCRPFEGDTGRCDCSPATHSAKVHRPCGHSPDLCTCLSHNELREEPVSLLGLGWPTAGCGHSGLCSQRGRRLVTCRRGPAQGGHGRHLLRRPAPGSGRATESSSGLSVKRTVSLDVHTGYSGATPGTPPGLPLCGCSESGDRKVCDELLSPGSGRTDKAMCHFRAGARARKEGPEGEMLTRPHGAGRLGRRRQAARWAGARARRPGAGTHRGAPRLPLAGG